MEKRSKDDNNNRNQQLREVNLLNHLDRNYIYF